LRKLKVVGYNDSHHIKKQGSVPIKKINILETMKIKTVWFLEQSARYGDHCS
jgi:hypothetical protein